MSIAQKYILFAIIATAANILSQDISTYIYDGPFFVMLSVFIGTGVGLVVKYLLDKHYIFEYRTENLKHDTEILTRYTVTGIITTGIFWGMEFGFDYIFESKEFRYLGGVIGLAIGYIIKYQLDKKFVFTDHNRPASA